MKIKEVSLEQIVKAYSHPSAALFRAIELKALYEQTKGITFNGPSLDLGCGDGAITHMLFGERFTYGVDNGEANDVDIAIKHGRYEKVLIESAEKMSLPDGSVNFVFSNSVIEHIPDNEAVLSEVSRILKKGGDFVFTSPSNLFGEYLYLTHVFRKAGLGFLASLYTRKRNVMLNHYHLYSHTTWAEKLSKHGLTLKKYAYYIPSPTLHVWDKMAIQIFCARAAGLNIEKAVAERYAADIRSHYQHGTDDSSKGASLFIHARK